MYVCVRANTFSAWYVKSILEYLIMPKYAVAIGRKVGIYDTYDECKEQVLNFPNAKFKKFLTVQDAEAYIETFSKKAGFSRKAISSISPLPQTKVENISPPELIKIEKVSPSSDLFNLTRRIGIIEEKLNNFTTETKNTLQGLVSRINVLENSLNFKSTNPSVEERPLKRCKVEDDRPLIDRLVLTSDGCVEVYTDGACSNNGKMGAQAGIGVWFSDDHPLNISAPVQGPATNNTAEIQAARVAITQAHRAQIKRLRVNTDSKFVINCITQWIHKWKKNEWKLSNGGPVKNKDELIKLDDAIQLLEAVEWIYVAGHKGTKGNEMADKLAREGAKNYKSNVTYSRSAGDFNVKYFNPDSDSS